MEYFLYHYVISFHIILYGDNVKNKFFTLSQFHRPQNSANFEMANINLFHSRNKWLLDGIFISIYCSNGG